MIKKSLAVLLALCLLLVSIGGCGQRRERETVKIVCTVFPVYDWAKQIVGDTEGVELVLLVRNGTDVHSYQPTTADIVEMISCDLLLYVGGDSETWVEDCLKNRESDHRVMLDLSQAEGVTLRQVSAESIVSGDHSHDHAHGHEHDHAEGSTDEHIWLSLRNAMACSAAIADAICALDGAREEQYRSNLKVYTERLQALDAAYAEAISSAKEPTLLFADRFPFVYLAEDYGLRYVAAFEGCTTEAEATPDTIIHLAEHVDEWDLSWILTTESSDGKLAGSVVQATKTKDQQIVSLDSMQSVNEQEIQRGVTYLAIMERNLKVLRQVMEQNGKE